MKIGAVSRPSLAIFKLGAAAVGSRAEPTRRPPPSCRCGAAPSDGGRVPVKSCVHPVLSECRGDWQASHRDPDRSLRLLGQGPVILMVLS